MQSSNLYEELRRLVIEDPSRAREEFLRHFDANSLEIKDFLVRLKTPKEGRLRQLVANAVRNHVDKKRIVEYLFAWEAAETDEFTRRAIEAALSDVDAKAFRHTESSSSAEVLDMYRYVGERLRHRLRNVMLSTQTQIVRLRKLMGHEVDADVVTTLSKLNDSIVSLGRVLEASDVDPEYFTDRIILLADWLRNMNASFSSRYVPVYLHIKGFDIDAKVLANDYLLENIFWNIWLNAHQAVSYQAEITIVFSTAGETVNLLIMDNGRGFPAKMRGIAFMQSFSTVSANRGRGLMEIQDAVEKLRGQISLAQATDGTLRMYVRLPRQA